VTCDRLVVFSGDFVFLLLKEIDQAVEMCAVCCFDENFDIILLLLITSLELCPLVDIAYIL
jgi:hypothetical protein